MLTLIKQPSLILKLSVASIMILYSILFYGTEVNAQEINPDPGTYSFGSTSEISPYVTLGGSTTSNTTSLAPTGQSTALPILILILVISGSVLIFYKAIRAYRA